MIFSLGKKVFIKLKNILIKKGTIFSKILIVIKFESCKINDIKVNNKPPITGDGMQNLLKNSILFLKRDPIRNNIIAIESVAIKFKFIVINISPP